MVREEYVDEVVVVHHQDPYYHSSGPDVNIVIQSDTHYHGGNDVVYDTGYEVSGHYEDHGVNDGYDDGVDGGYDDGVDGGYDDGVAGGYDDGSYSD